MSYIDDALIACQNFRANTDELWDAQLLSHDPKLRLHNYVTSYNNPMRPAVSAVGDGKYKKVEVIHTPRRPESIVKEVSDRSCVATNAPIEVSTIYEIDPDDILETNRIITAEQLRNWCGDNGALFAKEINAMQEELRRAKATKLAGQIALLAGAWASDVTGVTDGVKSVPLFASGVPVADAFEEIEFALAEQTGIDQAAIIGARDFFKYYRMIESGCCNNNGLDIGDLFSRFGQAVMYDRRLAVALDATGADVLAIQPGAIQILNYIEAGWETGTPVEAPFRGSDYITIPMQDSDGLWNELMIKDVCRGKVHLVMNTVVKAVSAPNNIYLPGDRLYGVNGVVQLAGTSS